MYDTFKALLIIVWILDVINVPQLEFLDTTVPINFLGWLLIFLFLPKGNSKTINHKISAKNNTK